jgi:hypothetical protein
MPCVYCGEPATTFYSFNKAATPDICPQCLKHMVALMEALMEGDEDEDELCRCAYTDADYLFGSRPYVSRSACLCRSS